MTAATVKRIGLVGGPVLGLLAAMAPALGMNPYVLTSPVRSARAAPT